MTKAFDTLTAEIGRSRYVALGKHFTDPDGHAMSYGIGSVDSSAVAAVVENSRLHISGRAEGQTEVTVIASDGRDSSEATVRVRVPEPVRSFRDDFDSEESLTDWTRVRAGVSVENGRLRVSPDTMDEGYAHRYAGEAPAAARWRIKVSMASADSAGVAGVRWQAKGGSHRAYFFSVGGGTAVADSVNWEFGRLLPVRPVRNVHRLGGPVRMERRHRGGRSPGVPHLDGGRPRIRPHWGGRPVAGARREAGLRQVGDNIHRAPRTLRAGCLQPGSEGPRSRLRLGGARRQMTPTSPEHAAPGRIGHRAGEADRADGAEGEACTRVEAPDPVRVLLVDDHKVVRSGLKALLESTGRVDVVGEASSGEEAVERARVLEPDVTIMDLAMPGMGGIRATRRIAALGIGTKVLVLTVHDEDEFLERALKAGAAGYLDKSVADTDLMGAIEALVRGHSHLPRRAASPVARTASARPPRPLGRRCEQPPSEACGTVPKPMPFPSASESRRRGIPVGPWGECPPGKYRDFPLLGGVSHPTLLSRPG